MKGVIHEVTHIKTDIVVVINTIDQYTGNEYITTITETSKGNFHTVNRFLGKENCAGRGATTNHELEERDLMIKELIEEFKEANAEHLKEFREVRGDK